MDALKNLPPFYPGQKVVYIGPTAMGLVKGKTYTAIDIEKKTCRCCHTYRVNVGIPIGEGILGISCTYCGNVTYTKNLLSCSCNFRAAQQQKFPLLKLRVLAGHPLAAN